MNDFQYNSKLRQFQDEKQNIDEITNYIVCNVKDEELMDDITIEKQDITNEIICDKIEDDTTNT